MNTGGGWQRHPYRSRADLDDPVSYGTLVNQSAAATEADLLFIFEVTVRPGFTVEEYAQGWVEASRIIQENEGAQGTFLHRRIGHPDKVLAIAHWRSKEDRDRKDDSRSARVKAILDRHAKWCDVELIGEYEEPDWQVLPPQGQGGKHAD